MISEQKIVEDIEICSNLNQSEWINATSVHINVGLRFLGF